MTATTATIDAAEILRPGLLEGVSVLIAGSPPAADGTGAGATATAGAAAGAGVGVAANAGVGASAGAGGTARAAAADSLAEAVGSACAGLGARVGVWDPDAIPAAVDLLVFDGAGVFARGHAHGERPARRTARAALSSCLDAAWEVTHAVVNAAFLPAERAGRIVYLAPAPDAGAHAEPARAGLENLSRTLSIEWARHGITTVTIAPGAHSASGEVAALVAYLASPAGAYFSGCLLDLRGPAGA